MKHSVHNSHAWTSQSLLELPSVLLCRQFLAPFSFLISAKEPNTSTECKSCFVLAPCQTTWIFIQIALFLAF